MLNPIDPYIRVKCGRDRVAAVDGCVFWNGDVDNRRLKERGIVIDVFDEEADLDQSENLVG